MTTPSVKIHDVETNEVIEREMTVEEIAQFKIAQSEFETRQNEIAAKAEAKQAVLEKLGLTAEELAALI